MYLIWLNTIAVQIMRMIETANCNVTSTFRNEIFPPPALKRPFSTFTGWNEDRKMAGYNPEIVPTTNGTSMIGMMICHFNKIEISRFIADTLFSQGSSSQVRAKANINAIHETITDSLRNCAMISFRCAPTVFRMPISLARNVDLAVERFM